MEQTKKRSAISWVIEFAGQKKPNYIFSILLAMCKVVFGLMPYLYMADIVRKLLEMHAGTHDDSPLLFAEKAFLLIRFASYTHYSITRTVQCGGYCF